METPWTTGDTPPNPLDKPGYRLEFHDEFDGPDMITCSPTSQPI